ncbi:MAG: conjugal transfer protein TrbM [Burkholderiaceae bacterium]|nr:conjugal transfer protein TrbM [Burkholderiaceae bacterium]
MTHRSAKIGAVALACACGTALANSTVVPSSQTLEGLPGLACQAVLCLSSSLQPSECAPSLSHYFGIQIFNKFGLDWGATVAARRMFLGMCPAADAQGMPARIDAIANGAGKCDPASLNSAFADTAYRYRSRTTGFGDSGETTTYDVQPISTVRQNTLPGYCRDL